VSAPAKSEDIFLSLTAPDPGGKVLISLPAEPNDIVQAIVNAEKDVVESTEPIATAKVKRFASFLDKKGGTENKASVTLSTGKTVIEALPVKKSENKVTPMITQAAIPVNSIEDVGAQATYYISAPSGFVIQIAGFTRLSVYQEFIPDFVGLKIKSYYRLFNQQPMLMITSEVFETRLAAEKAVTLLPSSIKVYQPWVKSLQAINNEINAYQDSQ